MEEADKNREDGTGSGVTCTSGKVQNIPDKDKDKNITTKCNLLLPLHSLVPALI